MFCIFLNESHSIIGLANVDCDGLQKGLIFMFLRNNRKEKIFPKKIFELNHQRISVDMFGCVQHLEWLQNSDVNPQGLP